MSHISILTNPKINSILANRGSLNSAISQRGVTQWQVRTMIELRSDKNGWTATHGTVIVAHLVQGEHQAEQVDQDPECVQDVVPVRTLAMIAMITVRGDTKNGHCYEGVSQKCDVSIKVGSIISKSTFCPVLPETPSIQGKKDNVCYINWKWQRRILLIITWTRGQEGSWMCASAFAARAPLRKVGPRFTVMLENLGAQIFLTAQISYVLAVSKTFRKCDGDVSEISFCIDRSQSLY